MMRKCPKAGAKILFFYELAKYFSKKVFKTLFLNVYCLYLQPKMAVLNDNSNKTAAIVLCTVPISDHAQLVHLYTQQRGRITCRVPLPTRGKNASRMRTMMTPMTLLQMVLKPGHGEILQIAEAEIVRSPYMLTLSHPDKAAQCLYIAELTHHVVRPLEQQPDPQLWHFLLHSLDVLENAESGWANFHLVFTCQLISQLGFSIDPEGYQPGNLFDMTEGAFTTGPIYHPYYLTANSAHWLHLMLLTSYENMAELTLTREQRNAMLDILLAFLQHHLPEMGKLKTTEVLKEVNPTLTLPVEGRE